MKKINHPCPLCENRNCFIQTLSPQSLSWANSRKHTVCFPRGQIIFMENSKVAGLYFIKRGWVKVYASGINGKEKIVRLAGNGHIVGHRGYGVEKYPVGAAVLTESIICFLDQGSLYNLFMTNPKFTYSLMMFYSQELRRADYWAKYNAQMTTRERVISALLYMKEVFGYRASTNILNVYLQRREIASIANTTAEDVSRTLTAIEKEKLVLKRGRNIQLLNEQKLYDIISDYGIGGLSHL